MVDKIVMLAERRGWDQGEVESRAGLARGRISKWKADQGEPTASQALRIARLFDVTMEFLADDELNEPGPAPSPAIADDERAIIDLYRDLELSRQEAIKRLATPLVLPPGQAWLPGSVRDLTHGTAPKQPRRPARTDQPPADVGKTRDRKPKGKT